MDHIFGDSHDIAFGNNPASWAKPAHSASVQTPITRQEHSRPRQVQHDDFGDLEPTSQSSRPPRPVPVARVAPPTRTPAPAREARPQTQQRLERPVALPEASNIPALTRLIDGMKPSFLPREEDTSVMRMVPLSPADWVDPLLLVTRDDTTILVGSGFGTMTRTGQVYTTFPDMRLVASEKTRLSAWILFDASIDVRLFQTILPSVGFPPIYATRDIIAKFRNNIQDTEFLGKCRFFELFADGMAERRIWDIEWKAGVSLILKSGTTEVGLSHLPAGGTSMPLSTLTRSGEGYMFGSESIEVGEILSFKWTEMKRHTMKFTFDTFYIDKNSVGVVAGYTIGDREQLAENWVLMFTLEEDTRARTIAGHIFIDSRGFVHAHEMMSVHKEILKGIRSTYEKLITDNPKVDRGSLVQWLRREITKYCYLLTGRTPVVMPILIER